MYININIENNINVQSKIFAQGVLCEKGTFIIISNNGSLFLCYFFFILKNIFTNFNFESL